MTDWWSTSPAESGDGAARRPERAAGWDPEPVPLPPVAPPAAPEPEPEEVPEAKDRKKGILLGAAGAAVVGILVFTAMPDGGSSVPQGSSPTASQEGFLPAAGGGPSEAQEEVPSATQGTTQAPKPKTVTLTARESGKGRVGVIVDVRIQNDTDDAITLLANFVKGDGRPALVGEGTLAPGSRVIEPGQTAEGTVEFAVGQMPGQVILVDLSGGIVAASGGN